MLLYRCGDVVRQCSWTGPANSRCSSARADVNPVLTPDRLPGLGDPAGTRLLFVAEYFESAASDIEALPNESGRLSAGSCTVAPSLIVFR
jgi:hypothetical protein